MSKNNGLYCSCDNPQPVKQIASGKTFKVCVKSKGGCGKEYDADIRDKLIGTKSLNKSAFTIPFPERFKLNVPKFTTKIPNGIHLFNFALPKYELIMSDYEHLVTKNKTTKVYRIKALKDFDDIKKGDLGGYIESEKNLSQFGNCWIGKNVHLYSDALVTDNARVETDIKYFINKSVFKNNVISKLKNGIGYIS